MKILVAEDDRVSRLLLETHLKRWGHEPVGAKA
jgi:CheY-like chemotaxis protein